MSVVRCDRAGCANQIDTDLDTECTVPDPRHSLAGHPDLNLCPPCREAMQDAIDLNCSVPDSTMEALEALGAGGMK